MAKTKKERDILNAKEAIENCIRRSRMIVFGNLPCYFYPMATGTDEKGEHVIHAVFYRSVIEGAKRPGDTVTFDDLVRSGQLVLPKVYKISTIYRTLRVTNRPGDFTSVDTKVLGINEVSIMHKKSTLK